MNERYEDRYARAHDATGRALNLESEYRHQLLAKLRALGRLHSMDEIAAAKAQQRYVHYIISGVVD